MSRRRTARRRAIDVLFQADLTGRAPRLVLAERGSLERELPVYTHDLVAGVEEHMGELDRILGEHAEGWTV
ncbi:MAG: N utilization substance protein B, partial [Actinobacteria bacterium]|nr:N utilization substance protein B [Actinomycetota bacterium]